MFLVLSTEGSLFSPHLFQFLLPKKGGGKFCAYFCFLSSQYAATPIMAVMAIAAMIAISVVMNGTSVVGSVGSGVVGSVVVSSDSNACDAPVASSTLIAVTAYEL